MTCQGKSIATQSAGKIQCSALFREQMQIPLQNLSGRGMFVRIGMPLVPLLT
jgi:hypothetical protein